MNFFKDPKYKSIRIVLFLVIIIGAGWFVVSYMNQSNSNQGLVINRVSTPASEGTINTIRYYDPTLDKNIKVSQSIIPAGGTSDRPGGGTVTCSGSCTGNYCHMPDGYCEPSLYGCTVCTCEGTNCSACTCTKTTSGLSNN